MDPSDTMTPPRTGESPGSRRERRRADLAAQPPAGRKAGRNLPVAIAVGLALGGAVLAPSGCGS
jgi:hypothetical protein